VERRLPERFAVVGCARSEMTHEAFRNKMREAVSQFSRTGLKEVLLQPLRVAPS
jgi:glucose-6-phosphate 1-dehydrogenase